MKQTTTTATQIAAFTWFAGILVFVPLARATTDPWQIRL